MIPPELSAPAAAQPEPVPTATPPAEPTVVTRVEIRRGVVVSLVVALVILAATSGLLRSFSTLVDYDDEGYLLLSVRQVLAGHSLYEEVYSQYGPAYFGAEWLIHAGLRLPLRHDITRLETLVWWLAAAAAAALLVRRFVGGLGLPGAAFVLAALHLERFAAEPGHPQGLAIVLTMVALLLVQADRPTWLLGGTVGVLALVKPNLGALLGVAALLTMLPPPGRRGAGLAASLVFCLGLLPALALGSRVDEPQLMVLGLLVAASMTTLARVLCSQTRDPIRVGWRAGVTLCAAAFAVATAILAACLGTGTSARDLLEGMVLQHRAMRAFFEPTQIPIPLAISIVAAGVVLAGRRRRPEWLTGARWLFGGGVVGATLLALLTDLRTPLQSGLQDLGGAATVMAFAPLSWLVVLPPTRGPGASARIFLALLIPLQLISVFPIAGSQTAGATLPLLVGALVVLGDALATRHSGSRRIAGLVATVATFTLILNIAAVAARYQAGQPLELPGTRGIRLPVADVARLTGVTRALQAHCSTFVSYPQARNSLYLWSELEPPTSFNATLWPFLLGAAQQQSIVAALERAPAPCVLWQADGTHGSGPLVDHIVQDYGTLVSEIGEFRLLARGAGRPNGT